MLTPHREDTLHKAKLLRLLRAIADDPELNIRLAFKGGTCAALRGYMDRFSVDLDFDITANAEDIPHIRKHLERIFRDQNLTIKDKSPKIPQYFLKYDAEKYKRNSIKIDALFPPPKSNRYEKIQLPEIARIMNCQTTETMFANKLVAVMDRFEKTGGLAGRDIYDIHRFFLQGFDFNHAVIEERTGLDVSAFFSSLIEFIEKHINETIINQDLNFLLPPQEFQRIRKTLKQEVLLLLNNAMKDMK